jgi:protein disulfide-isomerase-like protein
VKTFNDLDDFNRHMSDHSSGHVTLVKFFAPWCGHCKHLAPVWQELGADFHAMTDVNEKVTIAQVDCTTHDPICKQHSVRGFPTLTMFMNKKTRPYKGPRKLENLRSFVFKAMAQPVKPVFQQNPSSIQFQLITGNEEYVKNFNEVAGEFFLDDNLEFIYEGHSEVDRLLVSNMASKDVSFEDLSATGLRKIVAMESLPLWNDLTAANYANVAMNDFMGPRKLVFVSETSSEKTVLKSISESRTFQQKLVFGFTDDRVTQYFHIDLDAKNAVVFDTKTKNWWKVNMENDIHMIEEQLRVICDGYKKEDGGPGGWFSKLKHGAMDLWMNMKDMAENRPVIALLMLGLPLGVISCFLYAVCFMTSEDTTEEEESTERLVTQDDQGEVHEFPTDRTKQEREFAAEETENLRSRKGKEQNDEIED